MPSIGWPEIIIVLVIVLIIFGPKRLPHLGKSIGQSIRGFKRGVSGEDEERENERIEAAPAQLGQGQTNAPAQPVPQSAPAQPVAQPATTSQTTQQAAPEAVPLPPEPPASVPPAPEPGERSATQV
jgi:sec-independent protein translocase protein TatA